ncbi:hypothetical protein BGZ73_000021 [Actinomortierella ambigua]|nr:hypothetical protein BGZ73_000021 [Actinomortierella ambigua]
MDPHPLRSPQYLRHSNAHRSATGLPSPDQEASPVGSTFKFGNSNPSNLAMPSTSSLLAADHQHHHHYHHYNTHSIASSSQHYPLSPSTPPPLPSRHGLRERRQDPQSQPPLQEQEHPVSLPLTTSPISVHPHSNSPNLSTLAGGESAATSGSTATPSQNTNGSETNPSDLVQHCLLFPTYATRHSRSGSKDPHDWNIRVRGWAFSKRSNRRKRLVMSMARKIAGVTKDDNKLYETLESRFGMFLASNSKNARFSIQCVGAAETSHMELAGDPHSNNPTVNELLDEAQTEEGEKAFKDTQREKVKLRKALWTGQDISQIQVDDDEPPTQQRQVSTVEPTKSKLKQKVLAAMKAMETPAQDVTPPPPTSEYRSSPYRPMEMEASAPGDYNPYAEPPVVTEGESRLERISRGAGMLKDTFKKYRSNILAERFNSSTDSLSQPQGSNVSDGSGDEASSNGMSAKGPLPPSVSRTDSDDSVQTQSHTHPEDFGHGMMPTVQISTRIGGHFHGTLRVTVDEVAQMAAGSNLQDEARFLKLQAFHEEMPEECHGVVNLIEPEGISVISDIDDTIKETNVPAGTRIILRNTFLSDMQEVEGMAGVYKSWWQRGAAIHYVSNSPWQLIPSLLDFFHSHEFPPGSAHLRLHDSVIKAYFMTPGEHKRRTIREILEDFPQRQFILVGDSGEIDLEIYTEMAVLYPKQIRKIFIRDITTARLQEMVARMPTTRSSSFSSLIQKVPVNAVTSRLSYLVNRTGLGATAASAGSTGNGNGNNGGACAGNGDVRRGNFKRRTNSGSSQDSTSSNKSTGGNGVSNGRPEEAILSEEPMTMDDAYSNTALRVGRLGLIAAAAALPPRTPIPGRSGSLHHDLEDLELDPCGPQVLVREPSTAQRKPEAPTNEYPFPKVEEHSSTSNNTLHLPGQFPGSSSPSPTSYTGTSPTWTPGQSPLHSPSWGVHGSNGSNGSSDSANGNGSAVSATPVPKNPLEVWLDRVEACRRQLPEGLLTFFETSEALEQDVVIKQLMSEYERKSDDARP